MNDVINTLCTKSSIRLGKNGEEVFDIDSNIQQDLKADFDSIRKNIDVTSFNEICLKYGLPKWTQIFKGDFSGYSNGLSSKNKGNAFEVDYVNNFKDLYQADLEKNIGIKLGNCQISLEGGDNTKRPFSISGKTLYLGTKNLAAVGDLLKDVLIIAEDGEKYNVSLKTTAKVSFINTGIIELFPEKIFKEYIKSGKFEPQSKNNVNGQEILDMLGIDGNKMAEVFNKYTMSDKRSRSQKDEVDVLNIVKKGCFMDFMDTVVGCGYILVHKINNNIHTYDLRTPRDMKEFIGELQSAKVLYPNDGKAKRVDVAIETSNLKLNFEIRSKRGGIYPDQMLCSYQVKH
jgi:hypothetical protein